MTKNALMFECLQEAIFLLGTFGVNGGQIAEESTPDDTPSTKTDVKSFC